MPQALTEIWNAARDRVKPNMMEKENEVINCYKWNISIVSVSSFLHFFSLLLLLNLLLNLLLT